MCSFTLRFTERVNIGRYFESGGHNARPHRKVKIWLVQFKNVMFTEFIFENRRKLSSLKKQPSDPSSAKIYINPNLSPDDKFHQIKVLQAFNKLKFTGEDNKSSFLCIHKVLQSKLFVMPKSIFILLIQKVPQKVSEVQRNQIQRVISCVLLYLCNP